MVLKVQIQLLQIDIGKLKGQGCHATGISGRTFCLPCHITFSRGINYLFCANQRPAIRRIYPDTCNPASLCLRLQCHGRIKHLNPCCLHHFIEGDFHLVRVMYQSAVRELPLGGSSSLSFHTVHPFQCHTLHDKSAVPCDKMVIDIGNHAGAGKSSQKVIPLQQNDLCSGLPRPPCCSAAGTAATADKHICFYYPFFHFRFFLSTNFSCLWLQFPVQNTSAGR